MALQYILNHVYLVQCINVARRLSGVAGGVRTHVFRRLSRGGADPAQGPADFKRAQSVVSQGS